MSKTKKQKTRAQQLEDGDLVDVSFYARQHGFKYPTAVTRQIWYGYCVLPEFLGTNTKELRIKTIFRSLRDAMWKKDETDSKNLNRVEFNIMSECGSFTFKTGMIAECMSDDFGKPCITISDDWNI